MFLWDIHTELSVGGCILKLGERERKRERGAEKNSFGNNYTELVLKPCK